MSTYYGRSKSLLQKQDNKYIELFSKTTIISNVVIRNKISGDDLKKKLKLWPAKVVAVL